MTTNFVHIAGSNIGDGFPVAIIYEGGINHNSSMEIAKKMIDVAIQSGCSAIKWQRRTIEVVYSAEELARPRESPFGSTNEDLKRALEFSKEQWDELDTYCRAREFSYWASCWDEASVDFIAQYNPPCFKIASACLTDDNLLKHHRQYKKPIILSTGMSSERQVDHAVDILGTDNLILMHAVSTYPAEEDQLNLDCIPAMKAKYKVPVGWSGHERGLATTVAATVLGANIVERHGTLDRSFFGSDQAASLEPEGMRRTVRDIRAVERARGDGIKRILTQEYDVLKKLRRRDTARLEG